MTVIFGIDPGGTTGFCLIETTELGEIVFQEAVERKGIGQFPNLRLCDVVAMEDVVPTGRLTAGKALQLKAIGAIEAQGVNIEYVSPEERKRVSISLPIRGDHAKDAYRVAVAYAIREGLVSNDVAISFLAKKQGRNT